MGRLASATRSGVHPEVSFLPLLLISALAFVVPLVSARLRWLQAPTVVLEILAGIVIGRSGLGLVHDDQTLNFLSRFGFVYLMFLAGLEINFRQLRVQWDSRKHTSLRDSSFFLASAMFVGTAILSLLSAWLLTSTGLVDSRSPILLALIFGTTSVGVVVPTLKEKGETGGKAGQLILLSAILADVLTIASFTVALFLLTTGLSWNLLIFFGMFAALYGFVRGYRFLESRAFMDRALHGSKSSSVQIKVRGSLALLLVFVALAEIIGAEVVLGAFLAGALISKFHPRAHDLLVDKLEALGYGFFVPLFFIMVGAHFDAAALTGGWSTLVMLLALLAAAYAVKVVPALFFLVPRFGFKQGLSSGMLLGARLTLIIAISAVALDLDMISEGTNSAIILLAIFSCTLSPILYARWTTPHGHPHGRIIVGGAGRVGRNLAERLAGQGADVVLIDKKAAKWNKVSDETIRFMVGDIADPATLEPLNLTADDIFVALSGDDQTNLEASRLASRLGHVSKIIARDNNPSNTAIFKREGFMPLNPSSTMAVALENMIVRPGVIYLLTQNTPELMAFEFTVEHLPAGSCRVMDIAKGQHTLFILVRRGTEVMVPSGATELQIGDEIVAFGSEEDRETLSTRYVLA